MSTSNPTADSEQPRVILRCPNRDCRKSFGIPLWSNAGQVRCFCGHEFGNPLVVEREFPFLLEAIKRAIPLSFVSIAFSLGWVGLWTFGVLLIDRGSQTVSMTLEFTGVLALFVVRLIWRLPDELSFRNVLAQRQREWVKAKWRQREELNLKQRRSRRLRTKRRRWWRGQLWRCREHAWRLRVNISNLIRRMRARVKGVGIQATGWIMEAGKKLTVLLLVVGLSAGFAIGYATSAMKRNETSGRFSFKEAGAGVLYKIDAKTGEVWFIRGDSESKVKPEPSPKTAP